jgi:hypothetical protein
MEQEPIVENYPIPDRIWVTREGGKRIAVMIEPTHPRFKMSMDRNVKRLLSEEDRFQLAEDLMGHWNDAMAQWADCPMTVHVSRFDLHVNISDNPDDPGKMLVRLG